MLKFYKKQGNVSVDDVNEIFHSHRRRLQEFAQYFHDSFFGKSKEDAREYDEWYFSYAGRYDQDVKEQLNYVDWVDDQIHNPLDMPEIAKMGKDAVKNANKTHFKNKAREVDIVISYLQKDSDFYKIINES